MGFSLYLVIEVFRYDSNNITSWSGQSLFWSLILFFSSLFILFFPIEFLHTYKLINNSFTELIANILFTIIVSLFFLVTFQVLIPASNEIFLEVSDLFKATSFAGFIIVPISIFVFNYFGARLIIFSKYGFSLILFIWIFGTIFFI